MAFIELDIKPTLIPADWQLEDLAYLSDREDPQTANWSEMGVYKTSTSAWLIQKLLETIPGPRVLVVTIKSGKGAYFRDYPRCLPNWTIYNLHATGKSDILINGRLLPYKKLFSLPPRTSKSGPVVIVAHYHCFTNKAVARQLLYQEEIDAIIVDEAHRMKEKDTQWTRNIKRLARENEIAVRHIMTGSGIINRPSEVWSLLNFLKPKVYASHQKFQEVFSDIVKLDNGFSQEVGIKPGMEGHFRKMVFDIGVRRKKNGPTGVFEGILHEPVYTPYSVELNPTQRKMYDEIKTMLRALDQKGEPIYSPNVLSQLSRLRQICVATPNKIRDYYDEKLDRRVQEIELIEPSSKLDAVMDILDGLEWDEESKQQVVVFSCFKDPLKLLQARLEKSNIPYLRLLETMSDQKRTDLWLHTWPKKEHRVFLTTLQLGGESIDLTSADTAIFLDRSWSPKDNSQAEGRIYRPGQTKIPQIIHINAVNTTDQRIERKVNEKIGWFKAIFDPEEEE